jgi:hypothetical protein
MKKIGTINLLGEKVPIFHDGTQLVAPHPKDEKIMVPIVASKCPPEKAKEKAKELFSHVMVYLLELEPD